MTDVTPRELKELTIEETIGKVVCWTLHQTRVDFTHFIKKCQEFGITAKNVASDSHIKCFGDAVDHNCTIRKFRYEKLHEDKEKFVIQVYTVAGANVKLEFDQHTQLTLNKLDNSISAIGLDDFIQNVKDTYNNFLTTISTDKIRLFYIHLMKSSGSVQIRKTGGVYLLPKFSFDLLEKMDKLTTDLGLGMIYMLSIPKGSRECKTAAAFVASDFKVILENAKKTAENITEKAGCLKNVKNKIDALKVLGDSWNEVLAGEAEMQELFEEYYKVDKILLDKIGELENDKEEGETVSEENPQQGHLDLDGEGSVQGGQAQGLPESADPSLLLEQGQASS